MCLNGCLAAMMRIDCRCRVETELRCEVYSATQESDDGVLGQVVAVEVLRSGWTLDMF